MDDATSYIIEREAFKVRCMVQVGFCATPRNGDLDTRTETRTIFVSFGTSKESRLDFCAVY